MIGYINDYFDDLENFSKFQKRGLAASRRATPLPHASEAIHLSHVCLAQALNDMVIGLASTLVFAYYLRSVLINDVAYVNDRLGDFGIWKYQRKA